MNQWFIKSLCEKKKKKLGSYQVILQKKGQVDMQWMMAMKNETTTFKKVKLSDVIISLLSPHHLVLWIMSN